MPYFTRGVSLLENAENTTKKKGKEKKKKKARI